MCKPDLDKNSKPGATPEHGYSPILIKAFSSRYPNPLPWHYRAAAWWVATMSAVVFYLGPLMLMLPPLVAVYSFQAAGAILMLDLVLIFWPTREWPWIRGVFQLMYELFDFSHNLQPENIPQDNLSIVCMHPHGVIPIQGYLWVAFCDQYLHSMYGYGGVTDIAATLPLLRNVLGWVSAGSASKHVLQQKLDNGHNLYMLPGGVAEIFLSKRGTNRIKAKRYGLMKLALQQGACLLPAYAFGGNNFFDHLATYGEGNAGKFLETLSRSMQGGFTFFWGQYGLPIPYPAKVSMVLGDPIWPVPPNPTKSGTKRSCPKIPNPTDAQVSELLDRYLQALQRLFDQYKAQAGCPDAVLEIY